MEWFTIEFWSFLWDAERFEAVAAELGPWAPALAIGAMVLVSFLPIPAETVAIANGAAFGRLEGFAFTWIGAMLAAAIAFWIARSIGAPIITRIISPKALQHFEALVERRGAPFLLLARMIPLVPYTVVNYGAGLSPVRFSTFLWTSAIGMAPPIFAFVSAGALMREQPWLGWVAIGAIIAICGLIAYSVRSYFADERTA